MRNTSLKLAFKVLARRKVFTAISLVGITLTLVVLMVATAILDNVFAAGKPESQLDRMLFVSVVGRYSQDISQTSQPGTASCNKRFVICRAQSGSPTRPSSRRTAS